MSNITFLFFFFLFGRIQITNSPHFFMLSCLLLESSLASMIIYNTQHIMHKVSFNYAYHFNNEVYTLPYNLEMMLPYLVLPNVPTKAILI